MACKETQFREVVLERALPSDLTAHDLALLLCASFMCVAIFVSFWLILDHSLHYLRPCEQKHIIRILAMIPIYASISFLSLLFYRKYIFLELLRNCYEAYAIASFFTLLCQYVAPNLHQQKEYFRNVKLKPWKFPLNWVATPRSGLTWFNIIYFCVFQFCLTRPLLTIVAIIAQTQEMYCDRSTKPEYAHLWIAMLQGTCVIVAMYSLVQFHSQLKEDLSSHRPFLKILCVKLVLFLVFWQAWFLGLLSRKGGPLQEDDYIVDLDIHVGIPCTIVCFEMAIFAFLHHWAFPWKPYDTKHQLLGPERPELYEDGPVSALVDALNPWDYVKAAARGFRWLFHGVHHREDDPSYLANTATELTRKIESHSKAKSLLEPDTGNESGRTYSDPGPNGLRKRKMHVGRTKKKKRHTLG